MKQFIVIDCQHDFIDGTLACHNANEAVDKIVEFLFEHPAMEVLYSLDWHKPTNKSFKVNGGIWPVHCVQNEPGSRLDPRFDRLNDRQKPKESNMFYKGKDDEVEEYSAYYAKNQHHEVLKDVVDHTVMIAGIASEYCVLETIKELVKAGKHVVVLECGLGFVDPKTHADALLAYNELGVELR